MDLSILIETALKNAAQSVEEELKYYLSEEFTGDTVVSEAMRYSTLGGGKRIRAFLVLEFCRIFGGSRDAALPYACALECVHAYSLIHDDLPCMDDDDLRRGKPSCHVQFGEAEALLAGDGLLTLAFEICASNKFASNKSIRMATKILAKSAGPDGMVGGQTLDLQNSVSSYSELRNIYLKKTGALIYAACCLGYLAATDRPSDDVLQNIRLYSESIGLAFQIHDDILDVKSDASILGKNIGSDAKNNKKTVLSFLSLTEAEDEEALLTLLALEALSDYAESDTLCRFAIWLLTRKK